MMRNVLQAKYVYLQEFYKLQKSSENNRSAFTRQRTLVRTQHRPPRNTCKWGGWQTSACGRLPPSIPLVSPRVTPAPIGSPLCTLSCLQGVVYVRVCPEDRSILACDLHDTEAVAVGIVQHDKILIRTISTRIPGRPDLDQPLHFALLVVRVEIQM
jgi:hypothetical protein